VEIKVRKKVDILDISPIPPPFCERTILILDIPGHPPSNLSFFKKSEGEKFFNSLAEKFFP